MAAFTVAGDESPERVGGRALTRVAGIGGPADNCNRPTPADGTAAPRIVASVGSPPTASLGAFSK